MVDYKIVDGISAGGRMGKMAEQWSDFRQLVYPPGTSDIQITECRRAFYAGAKAFQHIIMNLLTPGTEPTEQDLENMNLLDQELKAFYDLLREGKA